MAVSIDALLDDFPDDHDISLDLSPYTAELIDQYSKDLNMNDAFGDIVQPVPQSSDTTEQSPPGFSPDGNSNYPELSPGVSQAVVLPAPIQLNPVCLQIIAQPSYGTKLRYRSDYDKNENRLGVLKNKNKDSNYQGPAIRIPLDYLHPDGGYFIRVSLVTTEYGQRNLHYFHPYELEHPTSEELNDRSNNSVWFAIQKEDCITGIKSFPALRIVKKRASDVKAYGNLRVFDCQNQNSEIKDLPQRSNVKDTINEYHLDRSQLAFTVGRKTFENNQIVACLYPNTTIFSEEMIEGVGKENDADSDIHSTNERQTASPSLCRLYKYAPKSGYDQSQEDMVIFLTNKLEPKKYGELKVTFECDIPGDRWSQSIVDLDIKDRMVSFKTPIFPYPVDTIKAVDVILRQDDRLFETIKYYYLATLANCSNCQFNAIRNVTNVAPNTTNKRRANMLAAMPADDLEDSLVPVSDNLPTLEQSLSEPSPEVSPSIQSSPTTTPDPNDKLMDTLATCIESIFRNNDYNSFFRLCRSFLKHSPKLIHMAIEENYSDLLEKFLPTAPITILQQKNELNETTLLHAVRLNRTEIIRALLKKEKAEVLLEDIDGKKNNIFHIIALHDTSLETIELLIDYLSKNLQKFDQLNTDRWTPLQLAIYKNNLFATKSFLKYFQTNIHETKNSTGDNLIHLAVRYCDLTMVKYLIEEGQLIEQGKQSNVKMTPCELAQSLQRQEMVEYFNEIYPQQEIDEDDSSDEN